jgi:hypothetical protein
MVPEFETAMNACRSMALGARGVALRRAPDPGAGAARVNLEPKQLREQARNVLREQRFEQAYLDWTKELRARPTSRCASRRSEWRARRTRREGATLGAQALRPAFPGRRGPSSTASCGRSTRARPGAGRDRPRLGALTQPLLERCGALTVIELDRDLAARLRRQPGWT